MEPQQPNDPSANQPQTDAPTEQPTAPVTAPVAAAPTPAPTSDTSVPHEWPGAFGAYKYSRRAVKHNWTAILGLLVLSYVVVVGLKLVLDDAGELLGQLASAYISVALVIAYLASVRDQKITFGGALGSVKPLVFVKYIINSIVMVLLLGVSILALLIPFFFVLPRLILAPYLVVDKNMGPLQAIGASWALTKDHAGKVWGIIGATIAMALLMITIIGIPFAIYLLFMYSAALYVLYVFASRQQPAPPAATDTVPTPQPTAAATDQSQMPPPAVQ